MELSTRLIDRRSSPRQPARRGVRLQCRRGTLGFGANLAVAFVDVSEGGVQMAIREYVRPGEIVEIVFEGNGLGAPIRRLAEVRWTLPQESGGFRAGVRFQKLLSYRDVLHLCRP